MIKKILIANRGEIAVRIIRACNELGIKTVAVYSKEDSKSLHVNLASESICIGENVASDSYLNMHNILSAAFVTNCDAIHPGFGFLSENGLFAKLVEQCGLIFIGPNYKLIEQMGEKSIARTYATSCGVPVVPGSSKILSSVDEGIKIAKEIGFPVLIKSANGGGGRGMRVSHSEDDFINNYYDASKEALNAFGSSDVYLEKYLTNTKHVEVQVIGDKHGNLIHLFERDCSLQRRNQKLFEETPCYGISNELRDKIIKSAVDLCKHIKYDSVGTVEFLVSNNEYYFIEMNTRVQVEHGITEMITGVDIIKTQIRVADNQVLPYKQEDIIRNGYSMECRINAEDVSRNFAPSPGKITFLHTPGGKGVRVDSAIYNGYTISSFYDSMILKLIVFAPTRLECLKKMRSALSELIIEGVKTNIEFHYGMLHQPKLADGSYTTLYVEEKIKEYLDYGSSI